MVGDARCVAAETAEPSLVVRGEMVDADAPATYRLPLVGLCDPADEPRIALRGGGAKPQAGNATATVLSAATLAIPPNTGGLTAQLLPAVRRGYNLAQRGAFFAARAEFIQVLRRVAQAKDAATGTDVHSRQLAAGLRAMDEADDFVPQGTQLEGELNIRSAASSHRTPVLHNHSDTIMPHEAVALYHSYAQEQLAQAAIDEQAGSMALYGLGKVYAQLAERRDDDVQCVRGAMTLYCAALDACPNNNLAANELGVLLCRTGHPAEAVSNFERAINIAPSATAYHNLAAAQAKLGLAAQSAANEQESQRLAAWERSTGAMSRRGGIEWVSPEEMARVSQPAPLGPVSTASATAAKPPTPTQSRWRF
jgi:tetratricopeptide (TPR) repeat protein